MILVIFGLNRQQNQMKKNINKVYIKEHFASIRSLYSPAPICPPHFYYYYYYKLNCHQSDKKYFADHN